MNKIKTEKGITLVALIITIVVLLILAAVAIGAAKNSDIIGYAQNAASMYNARQNEEEVFLLEYESEIEKVFAKDRIYKVSEEESYIKVTKNNKLGLGISREVQTTFEFEYVGVTEEIMNIVRGYEQDGYIPDGVKDSVRALKVSTGENTFIYLLLSKDEKIIYCDGDEFILEAEL